ncbi:hypothetical protein QFZ22_000289 [Streptomyces canus]|uniref:Transposase n=1 Tax=Streptomyces canus TaxID=58343 RepID=A0AAW8F3G1_9ACTN|nr:hypothetical protein [Streptomyces canus]
MDDHVGRLDVARLLSRDDEDFVVQTAITRPTKLGQPFTRWSLRKLVAYLLKVHGRVIRIGRDALRGLLARRGITFQRTKTWKDWTGSRRFLTASAQAWGKPAQLLRRHPPLTDTGLPRQHTYRSVSSPLSSEDGGVPHSRCN